MSYFVTASAVAATLGLVGRRRAVAGGLSLSDLDRAVAEGLPYASLEAVVRHYPTAERERIIRIVVPRTTRGRREAAGTLSKTESERLERVARLTTLAEQVWESEEDAQQFLTTPHPLLDGASPLDLATTELGARRVEDLLLKLEYSLPV